MASKLLQFPVRNAFAPVYSYDALARDAQYHTARIAEQVEQEMARKAQRLAVGLRIEFAEARRPKVFVMPSARRTLRMACCDKVLQFASCTVAAILRRPSPR